jgi:PAS domain S-box-containing protein
VSGDTHDLAVENTELRERLEEAESVLQAIRLGEIDAVIVAGADGVDAERVFTLEGADHPYRVLVESMSEGAATLSRDGVILYANPRLAGLLSVPRTDLTGTSILDWAAAPDIALLEKMVQSCGSEAVAAEVSFVTKDGAELPVNASFSSLYLDKERFCCAIITDQSLAKHHAELKQANLRIQEANKRLSAGADHGFVIHDASGVENDRVADVTMGTNQGPGCHDDVAAGGHVVGQVRGRVYGVDEPQALPLDAVGEVAADAVVSDGDDRALDGVLAAHAGHVFEGSEDDLSVDAFAGQI